MTPFLIFGLFLAIVAVAAYFGWRAEQKRTEALRAAADELGFDFLPAGDPELLEDLAARHLFSQGRSRKAANLLRGKTGDLEVSVFDYQYTVGSGKSSQTHFTTVFCARAADLSLPDFTLRPQGFWHKIGALFGSWDIDFDSHPGFSKAYLLRGPDEDAVRDLFTEPVLDYFEDRPGQHVEGTANAVIVYRFGARLAPDAVRDFLRDGFEVLAQFRPGAGRPG